MSSGEDIRGHPIPLSVRFSVTKHGINVILLSSPNHKNLRLCPNVDRMQRNSDEGLLLWELFNGSTIDRLAIDPSHNSIAGRHLASFLEVLFRLLSVLRLTVHSKTSIDSGCSPNFLISRHQRLAEYWHKTRHTLWI